MEKEQLAMVMAARLISNGFKVQFCLDLLSINNKSLALKEEAAKPALIKVTLKVENLTELRLVMVKN